MRLSHVVAAFFGLTTALTTVPAQAFTADFSWKGISGCGRTSPAFHLNDVPQGTSELRFSMTDLNVPSFHHGGSTMSYDGNTVIRKGAITYIGPCPPPGSHHRYRWTVEALDNAGNVLATTTASAVFPP